jgi:hypothetical protein
MHYKGSNMPASIIIDGVIYGHPVYTAPDYNKNVGGFVIARINGIESLVENCKLCLLDIAQEDIRDITEMPASLHEQYLVVRIGEHNQDVQFYALKKEDIEPLGAALSKRYQHCSYYASARYLASWWMGGIKFKVPLSYYYSNVSEEDEKKFSL